MRDGREHGDERARPEPRAVRGTPEISAGNARKATPRRLRAGPLLPNPHVEKGPSGQLRGLTIRKEHFSRPGVSAAS